jgi:hypothetical protein
MPFDFQDQDAAGTATPGMYNESAASSVGATPSNEWRSRLNSGAGTPTSYLAD